MAVAASGGNILHQIQIQIVGNLNILSQNLQQAQGQTAKTTQSMQSGFRKVTDSVSQLAERLRVVPQYLSQIAATGGAVFGALAVKNFIEDIIKLAARVEVLEVVSAQVGKVAGHSATEIDRLVQSIKSMNITTQQANLTVALMIQANLDLSKATQLARTAQDAAVLANVSSQEALAGLIHGIVTLQPEVLRTYKIITNLELAYRRYAASIGISFDELDQQTKQSIALNEVLKVGTRIHGTYEAAMTKAGKQLLSLQRVTEEFKLSMGREFQEGFARLITTLTQFFNSAKDSKKLHEAMKLIANVLDNLLQKGMALANFAVTHPNLIISIFNIGTIVMITKALGGLVGNFFALIKLLFYGQFLDKMGLLVAVSSALGYALSKLPAYVSAITIVLSPLLAVMAYFRVGLVQAVWALGAFKLGLVGIATSLPGFLGIIGILAGVIGLLIPAFGGMSKNSKQAADDLAELTLRGKEAASEFRELRAQALDMMKEYVRVYETMEEGEDKTAALKDILSDLNRLVPNYIGGIDDLTAAYERMKDGANGSAGAIRELVKENANLTIQALNIQNAEIGAKIPATVEASKDKLEEFQKWIQNNLYRTIYDSQTMASETVPLTSYERWASEIEAVQRGIVDIQEKSANYKNTDAEVTALRETWNKLNDSISQSSQELSPAMRGLIANLQTMMEGVVGNTEALSGMKKQIDENGKVIDEMRERAKTGDEPVPVIKVPEVQREDLRKLQDMQDRVQRLINDWGTKGLAPSIASVKAGVKADVDNVLLELNSVNEALESIKNKPQYRDFKDQIADFKAVQDRILQARGVALAAGKRLEEKALADLDVTHRKNEEERLKNQFDAGRIGIQVLKDFYDQQIALIQSMGEKATDEQKNQLYAMMKEREGIDARDLDRQEKHARFMLKYDEKYYGVLKDVLAKRLPLLEAQFGKESEEYKSAEMELDSLDKLRIAHHADKFRNMAKDDGAYFQNYISALDEALTEAKDLYGVESEEYKRLLAEKKNADEDYLSWRLAEWKKHSWYMQSIMQFMEGAYDSMIQTFTDFEMTGKRRRQQIWESMRTLFIQIVAELIKKWLMFQLLTALFPTTFGGMGFGAFLAGRAKGGYTGNVPEDEVAGFHHGREFVVNAEQTKRWRPLLEMLNAGKLSKMGAGAMASYGSAGVSQTGVMMQLSRAISRLQEQVYTGIMPVVVELKPATVVNDRGIHLASLSGEHRQKRVRV